MAKTLATAFEARAAGGRASFPFWLRKYKAAQDLVDCVSDIPKETFHGHRPEIARIMDRQLEHPWETRRLDNKPFFLRHRSHELDTHLPPSECVGLLGYIKVLEGEYGKTKDQQLQAWHRGKVKRLRTLLRRMKKSNFPQYWRLMQDFSLWHTTRLSHEGYLHLGWFEDLNPGSEAKVLDFEDYVDPETLYGCEETGESRFEVCKRKGKIWKPRMVVHIKDNDRLWKLATIDEVHTETGTCAVTLQATGKKLERQSWEDMIPFDRYATTRNVPLDDPVMVEEQEQNSQKTYFENLKMTDPGRFEQEWYGHISNQYYDGKAPTGSFRGWRQRFMSWDPQTQSAKRIRWVQGLTKYMQRRVYLGYRPRPELYQGGLDGKEEPWWVQFDHRVAG
eukprot:TRINITY_DN32636_c0_g1_i1.p2 TRINITY_DN32636_c0_g1~~TRINITY_DN32636_c0_g1_i1.p2  ORF type:complete len:391 (+),score=108.87 TRINITY_DN32636_c0_g1_i1:74-1246(+)